MEALPSAMHPDAVASLLGRVPDRVLVLGSSSEGTARAWKQAAAQVAFRESLDTLDQGPGSWDVMILDGVLEGERWDRWCLQRAHRALKDSGLLIVRTRHLLDLGSISGIAYVASRALREMRRRLVPRSGIPQADRSAFRGRRYLPRVLAGMAESVAFEVVSVTVEGHGWPTALVRIAGSLGRRTGQSVILVARRRPSLWGADRPYPESKGALAWLRQRNAAAIAARDARVAGVGQAVAPRELDVEDWARRGVLVFSPHPDDEVIGCGGTLLDVVSRGGTVTIVQVTDGSDSAAFTNESESVRRQVRLDEAARVAQLIGARELISLRADNRALRPTRELRERFRETLERVRPGVVLVPSFNDIHPDHQTVLRLASDALRETTERPELVGLYEVWGLVAPTHMHDVASRIGQIEELLLTYVTALKVDDYVHLVAERLLYNALEYRCRSGYLETFEVMPTSHFLELSAKHFPGPSS